jgi:hypothetical protein
MLIQTAPGSGLASLRNHPAEKQRVSRDNHQHHHITTAVGRLRAQVGSTGSPQPRRQRSTFTAPMRLSADGVLHQIPRLAAFNRAPRRIENLISMSNCTSGGHLESTPSTSTDGEDDGDVYILKPRVQNKAPELALS